VPDTATNARPAGYRISAGAIRARRGGEAHDRIDTKPGRDSEMRRRNVGRCTALSAVLLAGLALWLPFGAEAVITKPQKPRVVTAGVTQVRGTSGQLEGTVNPEGLETTYYFQYGPTEAYGSVTRTTAVGSGTTAVKVGQPVTGLLAGFHYRIVATNAAGVALGAPRVFAPKQLGGTIEVPKEPQVAVYGTPLLVTGRITGAGSAGRKVVLQSSGYPYLEPFVTVSPPATTNATGAFSFRVTNLLRSAQMRVSSLDLRPLYSSLIHVRVAVKVTFHARPSARAGLVRLYGTVSPALSGAVVHFQVSKPVRPGKSERETAFGTQFSTKVSHGTHSFSRFSMVVRLRRTGNYRALVKPLHIGALVIGSSAHLKLHAATVPTTTKKA
jgi:hypothetical protein